MYFVFMTGNSCYFSHRKLSFYSFVKSPFVAVQINKCQLLGGGKGGRVILFSVSCTTLSTLSRQLYGQCVRGSARPIRTLTLAYPLVAFMTVHARSI